MKGSVLGGIHLMVLGAILSGCGLFTAWVSLPLVGSIAYTESRYGDSYQAWTIIALQAVASVFCAFRGRLQSLGVLCLGGAYGLMVGALLGLYRGLMDQVQQIATPEEIQALIAKMEIRRGAYLLVGGSILSASGMVWRVFLSSQKKS